MHWTIDGVKAEEQSPPYRLAVTMDDHKAVRAIFYFKVTSDKDDGGSGTLRKVLAAVGDGSGILLPAGQTITLGSALPLITGSLVIEGNGATLTQSGFSDPLLYIYSTTAVVRINRLHFTGGRGANNGGAIYNRGGKLTLESCIFSDNRTTSAISYGGAVYTTVASSTLTISGCTFYGNTAGTSDGSGGAVYIDSGTATLTGNIFWGNTAVQRSVVYGSPASGGYNVSDKAEGTDDTTGSGWTFTNGDKQAFLPISPISFKPINGGEAIGVITTRPQGYPETDFYGAAIPALKAAAGAVQTATAGTGYYLDYGPAGPGSVNVTSGTVDSDSLVTGGNSVILTAQANTNANGTFRYWTIDGEEAEEQSPPNQLAVTMDGHKTVRAVFYTMVTSDKDDGGSGTLRKVFAAVGDGEGIVFPAGQTITLDSPLDPIEKSLIIEGNGATLTQSGFMESTTSQLLYIFSFEGGPVRISRLHFKGGRATDYGGAIYNFNAGGLVLESCIFSDNRTSDSGSQGGAICTDFGNVIISGCTFYGNKAGLNGGAIYTTDSTLTLTGNIFWENTAEQNNVIYSPYFVISSGGYNVSDKDDGSDSATGSGWTFGNGDTSLSGVSFDTAFRPSHASLPAIPSPPVGNPDLFPLRYFDGTPREITGAAPGAMPAQTVQ
jgi:predicted outer membrane repeat protein